MPQSSTEFAGQRDRILNLLKSRGYGQWVARYEFLDLQPRICDFTTRIFELRHKRDLNIQCETKTVDGEKHSRYRLLPGSWRELRGHPKPKDQGVLPIEPAERPDDHHQSLQIHKARRSAGAWKAQTIFTTKSWEQWDEERRQPKPDPSFELVP